MISEYKEIKTLEKLRKEEIIHNLSFKIQISKSFAKNYFFLNLLLFLSFKAFLLEKSSEKNTKE